MAFVEIFGTVIHFDPEQVKLKVTVQGQSLRSRDEKCSVMRTDAVM